MNTNRPVAVITGAGRGIGRAIAVELSRHGYDLLLAARTKTELAETAKLAGKAVILPGDVTSPAHAKRLVSRAVLTYGRIDVLVNNAGYAPMFSIEKITPDEWDKIIKTNLSAAVYLCKFAWPIFVKQKSGTIVNISSRSGHDPFPGLGFYGAAKAGMNLLGFDLARQGQPHNIRVHTLALAAVETQMFRKLVSKKQMPTEQILQPQDVAEAVWLCIDGPMRHTSGEVVYLHK